MTDAVWRVQLSTEAKLDFQSILRWTLKTFGTHQTDAYRNLLVETVARLSAGPAPFGSQARDVIGPGFRTVHIARYGKQGRHFLLYRSLEPDLIEVVRILHDRMELRNHLPGETDIV